MTPNSEPYYLILFSQGVTNGAFKFASDSVDAMDETLTFTFSSYSMIKAIAMKFPVRDTPKFSLSLYDPYGGSSVLSITVINLTFVGDDEKTYLWYVGRIIGITMPSITCTPDRPL